MTLPLRLAATEYLDPTRWRWVLSDQRGRFLADHTVRLDPASREYGGFCNLHAYLDFHEPITPPAAQLAALGAWIGTQVFGGLLAALQQQRGAPAVPIQLVVPAQAQELLTRPLELARFADGRRFSEAGIRFVYQLESAPDPAAPKEPIGDALRILAVFSLPVRANPLNLRRERYQLQRFARELSLAQGRAVVLRVLQYGATRDALRDALEEAEGWDIVQLSGHGRQGELLLETETGGEDIIAAGELGELLVPAQARLKLLILAACYSGAGNHAAARIQVGLDTPTRTERAPAAGADQAATTALPSLAQALADQLDCAALAMRYPVDDTFATDLMLALYDRLLDRRRPLPAALHLALQEVAPAAQRHQPLAPATPVLIGPRAAELQLAPPVQRPDWAPSDPSLSVEFPPEPERFVGRLQPMLRASQALAPRSPRRGVLFYGMPGAGKTACALELAYRHEQGRFRGSVWYQAPLEGSDISTALFGLMQAIQTQLNAPKLGLTATLADPAQFRQFTLPRLRALLQQNALLLVLDNLETLLTEAGAWRDPLWGEVVAALLTHNGLSRVVLTSRRAPADLADHPRLQVEAIHALSFAESVLLARELPRLRALFGDEAGLALLRDTLRVVQGHPKLLELADGLAADRAALQARVDAAAQELAARGEVLDAFFTAEGLRAGETRQDEGAFVRVLAEWTAGMLKQLPPVARLLLAVLCRLEPEDRQRHVLEANWTDSITRLAETHPDLVAPARAAGEAGLDDALGVLAAAGLVAIERHGATEDAAVATYAIHPGVAEAVLAAAEPAIGAALDMELGQFYSALFRYAKERELEGAGELVMISARRAAPYLLRQRQWQEASYLLEQLLLRDSSPATLAVVLPLLRRIAAATAGTERELLNAGVLANALRKAGRTAEAEPLMRDIITRAVAVKDYSTASRSAGDLVNLLLSNGRLEEALSLAEEMASYTRQAGLGPWTQLADEVWRLQILTLLGRYDEVLTTIDGLRPQLEAQPLKSNAKESVNPWNVRETLLDTGRSAALGRERWELALAFNTEQIQAKRARGADVLELARTWFNDYGPLLGLKRYDEARTLLMACRTVFEAEQDVDGLQAVYTALANLEDQMGNFDTALGFEQVALAYTYQHGDPEDCAISHNNLASYLERQNVDALLALAHLLAAAIIRYQTQSGMFARSLSNLVNRDLPPAPPAFAQVVALVERIPGVRFGELVARLPRRAPDGDAALAAIWRLVAEEWQRREEGRQQRDSLLATLAQAIAAAATDESLRAELEPVLMDLEGKGWMLRQPAARIWAGERDAEVLTAGLDAQDATLVHQVLQLLEA
ncbi:MAG TPA: hypothetical protein VNL77_15345 [Roseiflexaceae bacterium]|nr:hypothetical protein [Roseiflexaceae bacterium]